jgi:hypothetical protein
MNYLFEKDWNDYIKSKNDILKKINSDKIRRDEMLKNADREIDEMREKLEKHFAKLFNYENKVISKQYLLLIDKSFKYLHDYRNGKISGILV